MSDANQNYVFTPSVATLQLYPSAIDALSNPLLILDASYALVAVNEPARQLLGTQPTDLGRAIHRLETPVWPIDIRALAEECLTQRRPVTVEQTSWPTIGNPGRCYDVRVSPLIDNGDSISGVLIIFEDASRLRDSSPSSNGRSRTPDDVRRAAVDQRGTRDDQRGTAVDGGGTRDDQRGAAVDQRRARNDERGAAVDQRGTADHQRRAARARRRAESGERVPRVDPGRRAGGVIVIDRSLQVVAWNHRSEDRGACAWTR